MKQLQTGAGGKILRRRMQRWDGTQGACFTTCTNHWRATLAAATKAEASAWTAPIAKRQHMNMPLNNLLTESGGQTLMCRCTPGCW
jgi:hypothetical protein